MTPQTENGFTRIASGDESNDVLMALVRAGLTGPQYQIVLLVIRKTWGYNKKEDWISLTQFQEVTGLTRANVCKNISKLVSEQILVRKSYIGIKTIYRINKKFSKWSQLVSVATTSIGSDNQLVSAAIHTKDNIQKTNNKEIGIFLKRFNDLFGREFEITESRRRLFNLRLKRFGMEKLLQAVQNLSDNPWNHGKNPSGWRADPDYLLRTEEQVDKWYNSRTATLEEELESQAKELGFK